MPAPWQHARQRLMAENQRDPGFLKHVAKPVCGQVRVERQIGPARLQGGKHGGDQISAARQAEADNGTGRGLISRGDICGQPVRAFIQIGIGYFPLPGAQGNGVRR